LRHLRFKNTGFWFQAPGQVYYTFVPFKSVIFRSPYGGNYSTALAPESFMKRVDMNGMTNPYPAQAPPVPSRPSKMTTPEIPYNRKVVDLWNECS
jgi:hypothetical protein